MKQMWIQDNYVISIWNGEFYSLDNFKNHPHSYQWTSMFQG